VGAAAPAGAITDGMLDGNGHPDVGLMVAQDATGAPLWRCSGTLIAPRVFLTAGHCVEAPAAHAEIWFAADVESGIPGNGYPNKGDVGGSLSIHPRWDPAQSWTHDLGVVRLDSPKKMKKYGALPGLNELSSYASKTGDRAIMTAVGYGPQEAFPDAASWKEQALRIRMVAQPKIIQIDVPAVGKDSVLLSNNAHTGGTCFGDSGGPNFIGTGNVVVGVTSFGKNGTCGGTGGVYRVDQPDDLAWLATILAKNPN
jgi:secreted trypsin-like serine protease